MATYTDRNAPVVEEFRASAGKVAGRNSSTLLLTTTGARSGQKRLSPMAYWQGDGVLYVFASKGGAPVHHAWYHNLVANPDVTVEVGSETYEATATTTEGAERERVWAAQIVVSPNFAEYQVKTDRIIPVVALVRKI